MPKSSRALTIFIMSLISLFEITNVTPKPCTIFSILASIADTNAVTPNGANIFLAILQNKKINRLNYFRYLWLR